ncbi:MAG TPA: TPM domain-containing protein [Casimicrobiaceae bacterium]
MQEPRGAGGVAIATLAARIITWLVMFAALAVAALAPAQPASLAGSAAPVPVPKLTQRVTDLTGTLSASEQQALDAKLADWERASGNQLAVLLVPTTKPEPIEAYSIRVAEAWKIGQKGRDNGAIFLIAKNDHRMRIEVGYGLEGVLTDVTSHRIIGETVAPLFREGKFAEGVDAGVDRIIAVVNSGNPLPAARPAPPARGRVGFDLQSLFVLVLVVVPLVGSVLSRIFGRALGSTVGGGVIGVGAWLIAGSIAIGIGAGVIAFFVMLLFGAAGGIGRSGGMWIPMGGGFGGGGFGGGGFGGGGGFSGGGGGFGGGGASGSW